MPKYTDVLTVFPKIEGRTNILTVKIPLNTIIYKRIDDNTYEKLQVLEFLPPNTTWNYQLKELPSGYMVKWDIVNHGMFFIKPLPKFKLGGKHVQ